MPRFLVLTLCLTLSLMLLPFHLDAKTEENTSDITLNAENSELDSALKDLLSGFLENDTRLKELFLELRAAEIALGKTKIETGVNVSLSSGDVKLQFGENKRFEMEPEVSLSIPALNDTKITASFPLVFEKTESEEDFSHSIDGSAVSISTGIISSAREKRKISLLEKERALHDAKLAIKRRALEAESEFWTRLKEIYNAKLNYLTLQDTFYDKEVDFEIVKVQGYEPKTPLYRTSELEARKAKREADEARRLFESSSSIFFDDCGHPESPLPAVFPTVDIDALPSPETVEKDLVFDIEKAKWNYHINELTRAAERNFSLYLNTGFSYNSMSYRTSGTERESSIDAGLTMNWRGLSLSAGTAFPVSGGYVPALTFRFGWSPQDTFVSRLTDEEREIARKTDILGISTADKEWRDTVFDMETRISDLKWLKAEREEQFELYSELESDMEAWHKQGVVGAIEYNRAKTNKEKAFVNCRVTEIDLLLYKIELSLCSTEPFAED